jgi:hypothetical protein
VAQKGKKGDVGAAKQQTRVEMGADVLPRKALQEVEIVARALHREYAGKSATWDELAKVLELGPKSTSTKYLIWSAQGYGLITKDGSQYSLSETGRKIVAPTFDGEDTEARVKALLTPSLPSKFYTDYNGHPIPSPQHFPNVLETRYQVPRERVDEARATIISNAEYAGILKAGTDGHQQISLSGLGITTPALPAPPSIEPTPDGAPDAAAEGAGDWSKVVFVITPIGDDGTEVRKHADMMLKHLIEPVVGEFEMQVVRADRIEKSGLITKQIFEHLAHARLCVADLSFSNPNAFYELGVRHVMKRPTIQMIRKGDRIPFDVAQGRTIVVDTSDVYTVLDRLESARRELKEHVKNALSPASEKIADDNPIQTYLPGLRVAVDGATK